MITVITDKEYIAELQLKFKKQLDSYLVDKIKCWIGFPGGSFEDTVSFSKELNIWLSNFEYNEMKVNLFGIGQPIEGGMNSMTGQINFPFEGIKRRIAGVFAIEDNKKILILHRGKIGGGKPGIGKNLFLNNFRGEFVTAIDGNIETKFCLVGELNSLYLPRQVADFINEIRRIKNLENLQTTNDFQDISNFIYTDEHSGQIITENSDPSIIERTHGIVVNELSRELQKRKFEVGNDRNRDLFIHKNRKITSLFEIKTSSSTQNLYSAVGQLLIYSIPIQNKVDLIAVLPNKLSKIVEERLREYNITPLYYKWNNGIPEFFNLENILV